MNIHTAGDNLSRIGKKVAHTRPAPRGRLARLALALCAAPLGAQATTWGTADVSVNRIAGNPGRQTLTMPRDATVFETSQANLGAWLPSSYGDLRALANARAGIDIPNGALYGTISTFSRNEAPGIPSQAYAGSSVAFSDVFDVRSDSLPNGTPVDVRFDIRLSYMANTGVTGFGPCCSISNVYDWRLSAGVPYDSSYASIQPTGWRGAFGSGGPPDEFILDLGSYVAEAAVGETFAVELSFGMESLALANGVTEHGLTHAGQAQANASAILLFANEVTPSSAGLAVAARAPGGLAYLYSAANDFALPGLETFDVTNVQSHMRPLVFLPLPGSFALLAVGLAGLGMRARARY